MNFPGTTNDSTGYVCYQLNTKLNDGMTYSRLLETHPRWINNGDIYGKYSGINVPSGAKLKLKVGIIHGYSSGKVEFKLSGGREGAMSPIWRKVVAYADGVKTANLDLSAYAGQTCDFILYVGTEGVSTQDWAAWAEAKIVH